MRAGLQLGVLGPLEVRLEGNEVVDLGGPRQRALLAILALRANEVVSTDRLVDELWGEHPPATAVHTVQVFVSRLRGALGPAEPRLLTRRPGYVLELGEDEVDANRCERLYVDARTALAAGDASEAAALLHEAIALWRGAPLADFTYEPFAQAAIARLEELRMSCREELIEAELALGRHAEAVSELEALVREQPFRERPRAQLMLALYRSGRQADALDAFQKARRALVEELGVEPSNALRDLEQAILRQDESLHAPSPGEAAQRMPMTEPVESASAEPSGAGAAASAGGIVRKTATVLSVRIDVTAKSDPERARALVHAMRERAETIIGRHGGAFVAGFGGELVAVFGLPTSNEDDAVRAVRAADELRAYISSTGELVVHAGIDTGEVVGESPSDLFGEPLTNAAALARSAQDAEVLLSEATRCLAIDAVNVEPAELSGRWRLVATRVDAAGRQRRETPMVGRAGELELARGALARATDKQAAHLLTVIGDAGIGKSRLIQELADELDEEATVLMGRCLSYGDGIAYWPLREAFAEGADDETKAIRALVAGEQDAALIADVAVGALGLGPAESGGEQVPWAFRRILEVLARKRPVLLVIDDAHWAELPLLELVDYLIDWLRAPVLVVCLARPELLDIRPQWGGGHAQVGSVLLPALSDEEALALLEQQGGAELSFAQRARIVETAEGNPLFVEQLLAMSSEDPWWTADSEIPGTLQALIAARLDRLGPGERAFIARASIIGRGFWPAAVAELLPPEAQHSAAQHLRSVVHRGLVHPSPSTLAGEEELRFHHILIRDVAYRSTPKALRGELHERFAGWLQARGAGYEEFVGYHLEQAFTYRAEIGRVDAKVLVLASRAGECLAGAGRSALARGDANSAAKLLRRSADLLGATGEPQPEVLIDLGIALSESGDFAEVERVLQTALVQAREAGLEAATARALIELSYQHVLVDPAARVNEMLEVAERAIPIFTRARDEIGLARAWQHVGEVHWMRCHCAEMEGVLDRALEHAEHAADSRAQSRILSALAAATVFGPRTVDDGMRRCSAILERAGDDLRLAAITETMLAVLHAMVGDFERARERWTQGSQSLEDLGLPIDLASLQMYGAFIELLAGSPDRADLGTASACATLEQAGERNRLATIAALRSRLLYALQRYDDSERLNAISEQACSEDDIASQVLWRGTRGRLLARAGGHPDADEVAATAVALAEQTDLLMLHADALADHAEVMVLLDRPADALRDLEEAIALYKRKGMVVSQTAAEQRRRSVAADTATRA